MRLLRTNSVSTLTLVLLGLLVVNTMLTSVLVSVRVNVLMPDASKNEEVSKEGQKDKHVGVQVHVPDVEGINCQGVLDKDRMAVTKARRRDKFLKLPSDQEAAALTKLAEDCTGYREVRRYLPEATSREEEEFPLAFGILFRKDIYQVTQHVYTRRSPEVVSMLDSRWVNVWCFLINMYVKRSMR